MTVYVQDLVAVLARDRQRPVLRHAGADTTAAELLAAIARTARALDSRGVGRGDLVAVFAANRPEALAVRYAAHLLGAAVMYLPAHPDHDRRARLVAQVDPQLLVVLPGTAHLVPPGVAVPVVAAGPVPGVAPLLDAGVDGPDEDPPACRARPDDLAVVIPSGGTTGVAKGSRRDLATYTAMLSGPARPDRRQLANGSAAHLTQVLVDQTLLGSGTVVLQEGYDAVATLDAIETERVTDLFLVEPQLFDLMDSPEVPRRDLTSLQALTHVGALAPPVLRERARARLGPVVAHTYGASEVGIVSVLAPAEHDRPSRFRCAGRVRPGVQVRFRGDDGTLDPRAGRIEVRGPTMAQGYRNRPAEEAARFVDGWYRTGDLGCLDDEDMLCVLGRAADAQGPGAVLPVDLQDTLCRQPSVRYAVVVPDPAREVRVVAAEAWPGGGVDVAACRAAVAAAHGEDVAASVQVLVVDRVPLTEQGKPDRGAIRAAAAAAAAAG